MFEEDDNEENKHDVVVVEASKAVVELDIRIYFSFLLEIRSNNYQYLLSFNFHVEFFHPRTKQTPDKVGRLCAHVQLCCLAEAGLVRAVSKR